MHEQSGHTEHAFTPSRRATLATGSAAVVAWSTPLVVSTEANAAITCTPKCAPASPRTPLFTLVRYCPTNGQKWLYIYGQVPQGATCPCIAPGTGGNTPSVVVQAGPFFDTNNSGVCTGGAALIVQNFPNGTTEPSSGTALPGGFLLRKSGGGAVGSGCIYGCVRVAIGCKDRTGDVIYSYCDMKVNFTSTPANGSCGGRLVDQRGNAVVVRCGTLCNTVGTPTC
ncbi:exported hypothetical protein [Nostocoides australiense Ben110]|uniref:Uncharacterized protein n=1 Tax=Nostocoides australiense Ben110 TaxID=1193182 RepID=W6JTW2_9MICO|nr:hypothetical protein [Tetrasphaera australiensis]CCH72302.1 exported hypothetical protein [Tetrasphaera australiensis Ben110]